MKFDIRDFLLEQLPTDEEEGPQDQQPQGQQEPQQEPQQGVEDSPVQAQPQNVAREVFADIKGKTIKDISFTNPGTNAGKIEIYFTDFQIPMVISWVNDKVTVTKPPAGEPYPLT